MTNKYTSSTCNTADTNGKQIYTSFKYNTADTNGKQIYTSFKYNTLTFNTDITQYILNKTLATKPLYYTVSHLNIVTNANKAKTAFFKHKTADDVT